MPHGMKYPSGEMYVVDQKEMDITSGLDLRMPHADQIRFLMVSGTIVIGDRRARYEFTLAEDNKLHIEEVPWTIFSTLGDALETEFYEEFWQVVNYKRKVRPEFLDVTWIDTDYAYDVSKSYLDIRMSIFDRYGCTLKVVCPFKYNDTYLPI